MDIAVVDEPARAVADPLASDRRAALLQTVIKGVKIIFNDQQSVIDCRLVNVSETGVRVRLSSAMLVPERVTLQFSGGAVFSAVRCWTNGLEIGFALDGTPALPVAAAQMAWRIYEMVRETTIAEPLRLLQATRFFDDLTVQKAAEEAEAGLRRLEAALAARARRPLP